MVIFHVPVKGKTEIKENKGDLSLLVFSGRQKFILNVLGKELVAREVENTWKNRDNLELRDQERWASLRILSPVGGKDICIPLW